MQGVGDNSTELDQEQLRRMILEAGKLEQDRMSCLDSGNKDRVSRGSVARMEDSSFPNEEDVDSETEYSVTSTRDTAPAKVARIVTPTKAQSNRESIPSEDSTERKRKRLVPGSDDDPPPPSVLIATPIPAHYVARHHEEQTATPGKNKGKKKKRKSLVRRKTLSGDDALLIEVMQLLRQGSDPCSMIRTIADAQSDGKVALPSIESLSRIPHSRKKAPPAVITDGSKWLESTRNCGSFQWTDRDAIKFNSCRYDHKFAFVALVMAWGKTRERHYWRDCRLTVQVVAETLGYTVPEYTELRGWSIKVEEDGLVVVEYRKLKECLSKSRYDGRYIELYAMIGRCVSQIQDDRRWCDASILLAADKVRNKITRLSHAFHTAYLVIRELLWPVIPCAADRSKSHLFVDFVDDVFKGCTTRRSIISACHEMLVTFQDINGVMLHKEHLLHVIKMSRSTLRLKISELGASVFSNKDQVAACLLSLVNRLRSLYGSRTRMKVGSVKGGDALDIVRFKIHNEYFVMHPELRPRFWPKKKKAGGSDDQPGPPPPPPPPSHSSAGPRGCQRR